MDKVNQLLQDKLFQVIGSTPMSIAESLKKVDLKDKKSEGAMLFAISIFASAVNKSTLESYVADSRFSEIRPTITACLSLQGRTNMTAITLLGHCFLATSAADSVQFAQEFRKKMGQKNLWAGELDAGSLSEKQKGILKEKKRLTNETEATALGTGFLKWTGLQSGTMTNDEMKMFGQTATEGVSLTAGATQSDKAGASSSVSVQRRRVPSEEVIENFTITRQDGSTFQVPKDVYEYRTNILGADTNQIVESHDRRGEVDFINATRRLIKEDPDGVRIRSASRAG